MLSGSKDEVVPPAHMRELERLLRMTDVKRSVTAGRRPGKLAEFPEGTHSKWIPPVVHL